MSKTVKLYELLNEIDQKLRIPNTLKAQRSDPKTALELETINQGIISVVNYIRENYDIGSEITKEVGLKDVR